MAKVLKQVMVNTGGNKRQVPAKIKTGEEALYKVTTFVPESSADAVRLAMGDAGRHRKRTILLFEFCSLCENIHTNLNGYPFSNPEYRG